MDTLEGRAEKEGSLVPSDTIDSLDQYSWLYSKMGFPSGSAGKESTCSSEDTGDVGSIPRWEDSPGERNTNPLQYSYLKNPMNRGAWRAIVQRVAKSWTQQRD